MMPTTKTTRCESTGRGLAALCLLGASTAAWAHPGLHAQTTALAFAHPFTGLDHLLAMLAIGAWAASGARAARWAPCAFVLAALAGTLTGALGMAVPALESLLAVSVILGGLVLCLQRVPLPALLPLIAAPLGALHGNAHGLEVAGAHAPAALCAFFAGVVVLHALGCGVARSVVNRAPRVLRVIGAALVLIGGGLAIA